MRFLVVLYRRADSRYCIGFTGAPLWYSHNECVPMRVRGTEDIGHGFFTTLSMALHVCKEVFRECNRVVGRVENDVRTDAIPPVDGMANEVEQFVNDIHFVIGM